MRRNSHVNITNGNYYFGRGEKKKRVVQNSEKTFWVQVTGNGEFSLFFLILTGSWVPQYDVLQ